MRLLAEFDTALLDLSNVPVADFHKFKPNNEGEVELSSGRLGKVPSVSARINRFLMIPCEWAYRFSVMRIVNRFSMRGGPAQDRAVVKW